jgi:ferredoxin
MRRLSVDEDRCEGYGFCAENAPGLLRLDENGNAAVSRPEVPEEQRAAAESAVAACPVAALRLDRTDVTPPAARAPDSALTKDEIERRNVEVVTAHFHNENPDDVDKAIALYAPDICWEAPNRGLIYTDAQEIRDAYMGIFRTLVFHKISSLRRFASGNFVFDDQIAEVSIVGSEMPNMPFPIGTRVSLRLVHCFELRDGQITREIAYEMWREKGGTLDLDAIPVSATVTEFHSS